MMFALFFNCSSELLLLCWDTSPLILLVWRKLLLGVSKSRYTSGVQVANSATCFDVSSGFHGDTVSCNGHDGFSVGLLELIIFRKAEIFLFFSSSSSFNIAIWSINPWWVALFVKLGPFFSKMSNLCCNKRLKFMLQQQKVSQICTAITRGSNHIDSYFFYTTIILILLTSSSIVLFFYSSTVEITPTLFLK